MLTAAAGVQFYCAPAWECSARCLIVKKILNIYSPNNSFILKKILNIYSPNNSFILKKILNIYSPNNSFILKKF